MDISNQIKIPPYGQHFNCAERMLGKSRYRVFSRLIDECSTIIAREQMNRYFKIPVSTLSYRTGGMDRESIVSALRWLHEREIITMSQDSTIFVNIEVYISLIEKFNSLEKKDEKQFIKDLENRVDMRDIYELRQVTHSEAIKILMMMKGGSKSDNEQKIVGKPSNCRKTDILSENRQVDGKSTVLCGDERPENCRKTVKLTESRQFCRKTDMAIAWISDIYNLIMGENDEWDEETLTIIQNWAKKSGVNLELDGKSTISGISLMCYALEKLSENRQNCRKTVNNLSENRHSKYKYNINIKITDLNERSEFSNIGEEKVENKKEGFEGLDIIELVELPDSNLEKTNKPSSKFHNPYLNKPFFSQKEVENFTANVEECTKSPVKLFYYNFWGGLFEFYLDNRYVDSETDEYGNDVSEEPNDLDMIGTIVPAYDIMQIISQAYQETLDNIEAGFISTENGDIPVKMRTMPEDFHPEFLIDWKQTKDSDGKESLIVSLSGFRNSETDDVSEVKTAKSREDKRAENRENRQFIAALLNTNEGELTPIEKAVKQFIKDFVSLDEYFNVTGFLNGNGNQIYDNKLPGFLIKPWVGRNSNLKVPQEDLYSILNIPGNYRDGEDLPFSTTIFSYRKVQRWNGLHGYSSVLNEDTIKNALIFDD